PPQEQDHRDDHQHADEELEGDHSHSRHGNDLPRGKQPAPSVPGRGRADGRQSLRGTCGKGARRRQLRPGTVPQGSPGRNITRADRGRVKRWGIAGGPAVPRKKTWHRTLSHRRAGAVDTSALGADFSALTEVKGAGRVPAWWPAPPSVKPVHHPV